MSNQEFRNPNRDPNTLQVRAREVGSWYGSPKLASPTRTCLGLLASVVLFWRSSIFLDFVGFVDFVSIVNRGIRFMTFSPWSLVGNLSVDFALCSFF